jgi:hypothetical protein
VEATVNVRTLEPAPPDEIVTLGGLNDAVIPVGDVTESVTVPLNPFRLVSVIVAVAEAPCWIFSLVELALIPKSVTTTFIVRVAVRELVKPLKPSVLLK